MFRKRSLGLALLLSAAIGILIPGSVHATAIANSQISFSSLEIIPSTGTVVFLDVWTAEAFAQTQNSLGQLSNQFDSSTGGNATANAAVSFAASHASASAVNVGATASSSANIPDTTTAQVSATGIGTLFNTFMVTGGTGDVNVNFSVNLTGNLNVFTDGFGQAVQSETTFALELDGTPILFRDDLFAVGPNGSNSQSFSQSLFDTRTLQFNIFYFMLAQVDAELPPTNNQVPEPSTIILMLAGLGALVSFARKPRHGAGQD